MATGNDSSGTVQWQIITTVVAVSTSVVQAKTPVSVVKGEKPENLMGKISKGDVQSYHFEFG